MSALSIMLILMCLGGGAIFWAFNQSVEKSMQSYLSAYLDVLIATTNVDIEGKVQFETEHDLLANMPRFWQVAINNEVVSQSDMLVEPLPIQPTSREGALFEVVDAEGTHILAIQHTVEFPGNQRVTYLFGMQSEIADILITELQRDFFSVLILVLALILVTTILLIFLLSRQMIAPLTGIRTSLQEVQSGEKERLDETFPSEIQPLADQVNSLLSYISATIERHRTFAGNLAHALKTPLSVLHNEAQKEKGSLSESVLEKSDVMITLIDRNLARVKAAGTGSVIGAKTEVKAALQKITRSFAKLHHKEVTLECPEEAVFKGDEGDFYEMLGNVIENACKYAEANVKVSVSMDERLQILIEDDGPGIPEKERQTVMQRGTRLDESKPGTGIGLSITQDMVKLYEGELRLESSEMGGLKVVVEL